MKSVNFRFPGNLPTASPLHKFDSFSDVDYRSKSMTLMGKSYEKLPTNASISDRIHINRKMGTGRDLCVVVVFELNKE